MKKTIFIILLTFYGACSTSYDEAELINSITDSILTEESLLCGDFSDVIRGDLSSFVNDIQTQQDLKKLHNQLLDYQSSGISDKIPEDYNDFVFSFKNSSYRIRLHNYLLALQIAGKIDGFSRQFDVFTEEYVTFEWNKYSLELGDISILKIGMLQNQGEQNSYLPVRALVSGNCIKMKDNELFDSESFSLTFEFQLRKNDFDEWQATSRDLPFNIAKRGVK